MRLIWVLLAVVAALGGFAYHQSKAQQLELEVEKARLEAAKAAFEAEKAEAKLAKASRKAEPTELPSDAELRAAAERVFGDVQEPAPIPAPAAAAPAAPEPDRATAAVLWQVVEKNKWWHKVSYSFDMWSLVKRGLIVDLQVQIVNSNGLPIDQKRHNQIILPADGTSVRVADFVLVTCPACYEISNVQGSMSIIPLR